MLLKFSFSLPRSVRNVGYKSPLLLFHFPFHFRPEAGELCERLSNPSAAPSRPPSSNSPTTRCCCLCRSGVFTEGDGSVGSASGPLSRSPANDGFDSVLARELKELFGSIVFCDDAGGSSFRSYVPSSLLSGSLEALLVSPSVRASTI